MPTTPPAPPAAGGLVSGGWGPKVGSPAFLCPDRSRPLANIAACNFLTRNRLIPNPNLNCQLNGVGLYRLNSVRSNNRSHRPNRVILLIHWLSWSHAIVAFDAAADRLNSGSVQRMSAAFQQYVENRLLPQLRNNVTTGRLDERTTTAKALTTCLNIT